jgi:hypothetical protein
MGRFIFFLSSNLRSVVYLSPSFVVSMERNPLFSIWLAIQRPTPTAMSRLLSRLSEARKRFTR